MAVRAESGLGGDQVGGHVLDDLGDPRLESGGARSAIRWPSRIRVWYRTRVCRSASGGRVSAAHSLAPLAR
jgi:hypothetical protein